MTKLILPSQADASIQYGSLGLVIRENNRKLRVHLVDSDGSNVERHELALVGSKLDFYAADLEAGDKLLIPTAREYIGLMAMVRDDEFIARRPKHGP